ncbi:MAG: aspartate 1-decarboxylase [Planctomycetes bacterium]|nr:aspartate 1-decarboxylase [Planctomycetota bacterium]MCW8137258.1 aspartate 1-decarboxylase [Planctomycetota bacterium]
MFIGKLHKATVTQCDLQYQGSVTIDSDLLVAAGILPYQRVDIYNINNGNRFSTYTLPGKSGSGVIGINGAAARLCSVGDRVIIVAFGIFERDEIKDHQPKVLLLNEKNQVIGQGH